MTRVELARILEKNPRTIAKWLEEGLPVAHRGRGGRASRFDVAAVQAWVTAREVAAQQSGMVDVAQERARKERAQATLAEQTYRMREGDLLPRVDVERAWSAEIAAVRTKLLALPVAIADQVHRASTLSGVSGVERELRKGIEDALRELADPSRVTGPENGGAQTTTAA